MILKTGFLYDSHLYWNRRKKFLFLKMKSLINQTFQILIRTFFRLILVFKFLPFSRSFIVVWYLTIPRTFYIFNIRRFCFFFWFTRNFFFEIMWLQMYNLFLLMRHRHLLLNQGSNCGCNQTFFSFLREYLWIFPCFIFVSILVKIRLNS